ncbi:ABC transporter substrate-binding protein [Actinocatenispora thailandica]|uniref:ABC transporter substrate-binding protein n=1 Tax=Actinocatenispora thailandica TaxID=227318 RepID=A0A7R7DVA3_9ACTN|nr:ectoine/hydroxyectoine ABC transporter substrate-binding protein EhuB [Actinocatenispora thailandica]BCJ38446.1 ABC transporter substrate-binding protein [Actinocatenispora thailandica]
MTDNSQWSRRTLLRSAAVGGGLLTVPGLLAACSRTQTGTGASKEDTLSKIKSSKTVTIGFAGEQPYGFKKGGELTGEAPTLHKKIFGELGITNVKGVLVQNFDALIPGLTAGHFDVISAGMSITPERCKKVLFSEPEFTGATALMVKKGNPKKLSALKSVATSGATLGVLTAAVEKGYAQAYGVSDSKIKSYGSQQDALDAMLNGQIDAIALTDISLHWLAHLNAGKPVEVLASFVPVVKGTKQTSAGGAVFRKSDTSLQAAFNKKLKAITSNESEYLSLLKPFGFGKNNVPPASLTTSKLCAG